MSFQKINQRTFQKNLNDAARRNDVGAARAAIIDGASDLSKPYEIAAQNNSLDALIYLQEWIVGNIENHSAYMFVIQLSTKKAAEYASLETLQFMIGESKRHFEEYPILHESLLKEALKIAAFPQKSAAQRVGKRRRLAAFQILIDAGANFNGFNEDYYYPLEPLKRGGPLGDGRVYCRSFLEGCMISGKDKYVEAMLKKSSVLSAVPFSSKRKFFARFPHVLEVLPECERNSFRSYNV